MTTWENGVTMAANWDCTNGRGLRYINNKNHIRSEIGPWKDSTGTLVTIDHNSMLKNYCSSVFSFTAEADHIISNNTNTNNEMGSTPKLTLHNFERASKDIQKALSDMKINNSQAPKLHKEAKSEIVDTLWSLLNETLLRGLSPADWKTASVTQIFKKDTRNTPKKYRPLSLTL